MYDCSRQVLIESRLRRFVRNLPCISVRNSAIWTGRSVELLESRLRRFVRNPPCISVRNSAIWIGRSVELFESNTMFFLWLRRRRRKKLLSVPFPISWCNFLEQNVCHAEMLSESETKRWQQCLQIVVAEKNWEGCNGLTMTDEIKVTIAGLACLLAIGFDAEYFDRLQTVLVYPNTYLAKEVTHGPGGLVSEGEVPRLGETWHAGPVILTWDSVLSGGRCLDGHNVVLHEFAHYLDMQSDIFDGTPPLEESTQYRTWNDVMSTEYHKLVRQAQAGEHTLLDHYGATSVAEFFAVATESFFETPQQMDEQHPQLYELLKTFYKQDPAVRLT